MTCKVTSLCWTVSAGKLSKAESIVGRQCYLLTSPLHLLPLPHSSSSFKSLSILPSPASERLPALPAGLLKGKKATAHPAFSAKLEDQSAVSSRVVVDGKLVTSRGPGTAFEFALALVKMLYGEEKMREVAGPMVGDACCWLSLPCCHGAMPCCIDPHCVDAVGPSAVFSAAGLSYCLAVLHWIREDAGGN